MVYLIFLILIHPVLLFPVLRKQALLLCLLHTLHVVIYTFTPML